MWKKLEQYLKWVHQSSPLWEKTVKSQRMMPKPSKIRNVLMEDPKAATEEELKEDIVDTEKECGVVEKKLLMRVNPLNLL